MCHMLPKSPWDSGGEVRPGLAGGCRPRMAKNEVGGPSAALSAAGWL